MPPGLRRRHSELPFAGPPGLSTRWCWPHWPCYMQRCCHLVVAVGHCPEPGSPLEKGLGALPKAPHCAEPDPGPAGRPCLSLIAGIKTLRSHSGAAAQTQERGTRALLLELLSGRQRAPLRAGRAIPEAELGSLKLPRSWRGSAPGWVSDAEAVLDGGGTIHDNMFGTFP